MISPSPVQEFTSSLVFLLDVDNTLLDNDRIKDEMASRVLQIVGNHGAELFWELYESVRAEKEFVDFPTTVERWVSTSDDSDGGSRLLEMLEGFPFEEYLFPHVMETLRYLHRLGTPVILSDGDGQYQPLKIRRSGLADAVQDNVLVYVHKEDHLSDVFRSYPADHYVVVDDKPRILGAIETYCPTTFTSVLVLQGKYAADSSVARKPDVVLTAFEALRELSRTDFFRPHPYRSPPHP